MRLKSFFWARAAACLFAALALLFASAAHAGSYFQDYGAAAIGATNFGDGSQLFSTHPGTAAGVADSSLKELQLTDYPTGSTRTALLLPDLDPGARVGAFSAKWNAVIYGNFPTAADGYSFNFGQLRNRDLLSSTIAQESGYGEGLSVGIQVYGPNAPGFHLRLHGKQLAYVPADPTTTWGNFGSTRHFFEVDWDYINGLTLRVNGQTIFTNIATPTFLPAKGNSFVFAARTGGWASTIRLDNIVVVTGGTLKPVTTTAPYYSNQGSNPSHDTAKAFDDNIETYWAAFTPSGHAGATLSSPAAVRVYALTSASTGSSSADPRTWTLEGSNNGSTWTACGSGSTAWMYRPETRAWIATSANNFSAYRLNISASNGGSVALSELRMWRLEPVSVPEFQVVDPGFPNLASSAVSWGDYDNDGFLDVLLMGQNGTNATQIWRNNGNGSFTQNTSVNLPQRTTGNVAWGDYDNDGFLDFAMSGIESWPNGAPIQIWHNNGNGTFTLNTRTTFNGITEGSLAWMDYNRDGRPDLIVCGLHLTPSGGYVGHTTELWNNNGDGTFTYVSSGLPSVQDGQIAVADYDNDGWQDALLVGIVGGGWESMLYRNQGNGTFARASLAAPGVRFAGAAWGDFNNDNAFDFAMGGWRVENGSIRHHTMIWRQDQAGPGPTRSFSLPSELDFTGTDLGAAEQADFAWGDFDADGFQDLIVSGAGVRNSLGVLRNNGNGTFTRVYNIPAPRVFAGQQAWADFDRDGCLDLMVTGYNRDAGDAAFTRLYHNNRSSTNRPPGAPSISGAQTPSGNNVRLVWWAPVAANVGSTPVNGLTYNLRLGTTPGGSDIFNPMADSSGVRRVIGYGNLGKATNLNFSLPKGTYYGAVQAIDHTFAGGPFGPEFTFTITGNGSAPSLSTVPASPVTATSAQLNADVVPNGSGTAVWFNWGTTPAFGNTTAARSVGNYMTLTAAETNLAGLSNATTYFFRSVASNANGTTIGTTQSFTTLGAPPVASTAPAVVSVLHSAGLRGSVNPNHLATRAWFEWGATTNYGQQTASTNLPATSASFQVAMELTGLTPGASYHFRIIASNALGRVNGENRSLTALQSNAWFDVTQPGDAVTGTSTNSPAGQSPNRAFDNSVDTKYLNFDQLNTGIQVTPAQAVAVRALTLISAEDAPERDPASFILEGSTNGTTYYPVASNAVPDFIDRNSIQSFAFANEIAWTSYRLRFPTVRDAAVANSMQIAEVELLPYPEITSTNDAISAATDGVLWSQPERLVDRRVLRNEDKLAIYDLTTNVVVTITPAAGRTVLKGIELLGSNDSATYPERHPLTFTVAGSNDGTNFVPVTSPLHPRVPAANRLIEGFHVIDNTNSYRTYRFSFAPQTSGNWWHLAELRLFGAIEQVNPPVLRAETVAGQLVLRWPDLPGFILEQAATVTGTWSAVTNQVWSSSGNRQVEVPTQAPARFFRLRQP